MAVAEAGEVRGGRDVDAAREGRVAGAGVGGAVGGAWGMEDVREGAYWEWELWDQEGGF